MGKKEGLIESTIISTIGSLATRTLGMITGVFICNKIGAEGTGVYQLMMTIYYLSYMFASAGIITAVSKLVSEAISKGWGVRAKKLMNSFFRMGIVMSGIMSAGLFLYAHPISVWILRDTRSIMGLKVLAFSIPFMTLSACYKGYFYAVQKVIKPVSAEIFEQMVKLVLIGMLLTAWGEQGIGYGCAAIALGIVIGEILSFLYLGMLYLGDTSMRNNRRIAGLREPSPIWSILKVVTPLAIGAYIGGSLGMVENIIIPHGLKASGLDNVEALSAYGMIKGMVMPLIFFPTAFLAAGATILIPEIAKAKTLKWDGRIENLTNRVMHFTMILAMFIMSIYSIYGKELGLVMYHNPHVGKFIQMLVIIIPFAYVEMMLDGILKGLGEQNSCLIYRIIDSVFRVLLMYFLIPIRGINAVIFVSIFMSIVTVWMMIHRLKQVTGFRMQWAKWINYPILSALAATMVSRVFMERLFPRNIAFNIKVILALISAGVLYIIFLMLLESLTKEDLKVFRRTRHVEASRRS